jgi:hypothetical protein
MECLHSDDSPWLQHIQHTAHQSVIEMGWTPAHSISEAATAMFFDGKGQSDIKAMLVCNYALGRDDPAAAEFTRWLFEQHGHGSLQRYADMEFYIRTMPFGFPNYPSTQESATQHNHTQSWLYRLPAELRNRIYELALPAGQGLAISVKAAAAQPALTRVCKLIRQEALPVSYGNNAFLINLDQDGPRDFKTPERWLGIWVGEHCKVYLSIFADGFENLGRFLCAMGICRDAILLQHGPVPWRDDRKATLTNTNIWLRRRYPSVSDVAPCRICCDDVEGQERNDGHMLAAKHYEAECDEVWFRQTCLWRHHE